MSRRNARERKRVRIINDMLRILREKLPEEWTSKKMSKLEILRKSTLIKLTGEDSFRKDHKYCAVLESGSENRKTIEEISNRKNKLKVDNITESERRFIAKMNKRVKSLSYDEMMEDTAFDDSNSDIGEDDQL